MERFIEEAKRLKAKPGYLTCTACGRLTGRDPCVHCGGATRPSTDDDVQRFGLGLLGALIKTSDQEEGR